MKSAHDGAPFGWGIPQGSWYHPASTTSWVLNLSILSNKFIDEIESCGE
jgi:hypothetical protein